MMDLNKLKAALAVGAVTNSDTVRDLIALIERQEAELRARAVPVAGEFTTMVAVGSTVYLPRISGGFDVSACPNPEALAKFIADSCNSAAHAQPLPVAQAAVPDAQQAFENYFCMTLSDDNEESVELYDACKAAASDAWNEATRRALAAPQAPQPQALTDAEIDAIASTFCPEALVTAGAIRRLARAILAAAPQPQAVDEAITDDEIKAIAVNYATHVGPGLYDVTEYDSDEDFFNCVRAILAAMAAREAK